MEQRKQSHPTLHLSISKDGNLIISKQRSCNYKQGWNLNNQLESLMEIPTENVHYLHVSNKYIDEPKIFMGQLDGKESLQFQVTSEQHQQWQKTLPSDILKLFIIRPINLSNKDVTKNQLEIKANNEKSHLQDSYASTYNYSYALKDKLDCLVDLSLKQYVSLPSNCYENFICIKHMVDGNYFGYTYVNLDYVVDIDIGFNYKYQPYNFLFRFKKNNSEFQYIPSLLGNLSKYVVQVSLDGIQLSAGEVGDLLDVINAQLYTSLHIQKSYKTIENLSLIQEKLDNLVKLEQQKLF